MADQPDDTQQIPGFVQDNSDVIDGHPPLWQDLAPKVRAAFPDFKEEQIGQLKEQYTRSWNLEAARQIARYSQENPGTQFMRHWLPLAGTVQNLELARRASNAQARFDAGNPTDDDYQQIAFHEARQQRDAAQPWYTQAAQGAVKMAGEAVMAGGLMPSALTPAAGASLGTRVGLGAARVGVNTALIPSAGASNVVAENAAAGRHALDPRGLPKGLAQAFAQQAVFEVAGGVTGKYVPGVQGPGLSRALGRTALAGIETPFLQQGADLVSGSLGLQTGYGTIDELLQGKYGDAGRNVATQALTGALMHGVHEGRGLAEARTQIEAFAGDLQAKAKKGYTIEEGIRQYEAQGPRPGQEESPVAPGHTPDGGIQPVPGEFPPEPAMPPQGAPEAPPSAPQPQESQTPASQPPAAPQATPAAAETPPEAKGPFAGLTREQIEQVSAQLAGRKVSTPAALVDALAKKGHKADAIQAISDSLTQQMSAPPAPEPQKAATYQAPTESQPAAPEPQKPALSDWHEAYQRQRRQGLGHDKASALADLHDEQTWVHSGTEFSGESKDQFVAADGKNYRIDPTFWAAHSDLGGEGGGVRLGVKDADGREVASVGFLKQADGSWSAESPLMSEKDEQGNVKVRGLARALYDHMLEAGQAVKPSKNGRTGDGKDFWRKNAEKAVGLGKEAPAPSGAPAKPSVIDRLRAKQAGLTIAAKPQPPPERTPSESEETPEAYRARLAETIGKKGGNPALVEKAVQGSGATSPEEWDAHAQREGIEFGRTETRYAHELARGQGEELADEEEEGRPTKKWVPDQEAQAAIRAEKDAKGEAPAYPTLTQEFLEDPKARRALDDAGSVGLDLLRLRLRRGEIDPQHIDSIIENPELLTRNQGITNAILAGDARRLGIEPEALRRAIAAQLQKDVGAVRPSDASQASGPPAPAHAGTPTAAGVPEAAGSKLTPAQRMERARRGRAVPKEYEQQAVEAGIPPDHLHSMAKEVMTHDRQAVAEHNAMLKDAREALQEFGGSVKLIHLERYEEGDQIRGMDEVGDYLAKRYPSLTDAERENPSDFAFRLLKAGNRKPIGEQGAYQQALEHLTDRKAVEDAREQSRRQGASSRAAEEALRSGQEAGHEAADSQAITPDSPGDPEDAESAGAVESDAIGADTSFDFGANEPASGGRSGPADRGPGGEPVGDAVRDFLADEGGHLDLAIVQPYAQALKRGYDRLKDFLDKLGGKIAPMTTRLSRTAGDAIARFDSARRGLGAAFQAPLMTERILGKNATPEQDRRAGAVLTERRLRWMRQAYSRQAAMASAEAAKARSAGDQEGATAAARRATEMMRAASEVNSTIGWQNSPFQTFQEYKQALASPEIREMLRRWDHPQGGMVPLMEANFRKAQGLDIADDIHDFTQVPGSPMNLKGLAPGEDSPTAARAPGTGRGNLRSPKIARFQFAEQAKGNAEAYDLSLANIIENSLRRGNFAAEKASLYRTLESQGVGQWLDKGSAAPDGYTVFRDVNPPKGTQAAEQGQTAFAVKDEAAGEFRQVLQADQPFAAPEALKAATGALNWASMASLVEPLTHMKNQVGLMMTRLGWRGPGDYVNHVMGLMAKDEPTRARLAELAKMDAMQEPGGAYQGKILPASAQIAGYHLDPTHYLSRAVEVSGQAMRLAMDDAFDRMAKRGMAVPDETARRNFINQLGNYSKGTQNQLVALLRDSGVGPFATAGANFNVLGLRSVLMNPGVEATSPAAAAQLRGAMLARTLGYFAAGAALNYLAWGRLDGDDKTPLGTIKLGTDASGKTHYLPVANWLGVDRGMKAMGAYAFAEGNARPAAQRAAGQPVSPGRPLTHSRDLAGEQLVDTWMHPALGPGYQFAHTWISGENAIGMRVSPKVSPGDQRTSQGWENLKAAVSNANPPVASLGGFNQPGRKSPSIPERLEGLTGPFVRARKTAPGKDTGLIRR